MFKQATLIVLFAGSFTVSGQNYTEIQKITGADRSSSDEFGKSISASTNYFLVGAFYDYEDAAGLNPMMEAGSAYIFERGTSNSWNQIHKLVASDRGAEDRFGTAVAITDTYAVIGADYEGEDENGMNSLDESGSAYVFTKDISGNWAQFQKVVASDRADNDRFGNAVAISGDYTIIGAHLEDHDENGANLLYQAGSVYIFKRNSADSLIQVQKIIASDRLDDDEFGRALAISGDYIAVGAYNRDDNTLTRSGAVYVFRKDLSGVWNEVQKITASDQSAYDEFGWSVALNDSLLVVGARTDDEGVTGGPLTYAGSAYVFRLNAAGVWVEDQKIAASDREANDYFGFSVAVENGLIAIGTPRQDTDASGSNVFTNAGAVYLFSQNTSGDWIEIQKVVSTDRYSNDEFGHSVCLSDSVLFSGARYEGNSTGTIMAGAAYVFMQQTGMGTDIRTQQNGMDVYPNPTRGDVYVDIGVQAQPIQFQVYNAFGKLVLQKTFNGSEIIRLNLPGLTGVYYIRGVSEGNTEYSGTVIRI